MKVAIVSINYRPELTGIAVYTAGMAEYLAKVGHEVDVFTGFPYYPLWRKRNGDRWVWRRIERIDGVRVNRNYLYVPAKPTALKRMLHELSFIWSVSWGYLLSRSVDCTVIVSPPLFAGIPIALLAKLKGSRTVFHVQDLQPDAALELGMLKPGRIASLFYRLEKLTYRLCNQVSTISEGMRQKIIGKGVPPEKVVLFRNWANDDRVAPLDTETSLRHEWGLAGKFVALYAGNLGLKQGLGTLLECAQLMRDLPEVAFVIAGDGGEKSDLERRAAAMGLTNLMFRPLQSEQRLSELLATADVSLMPQKAGVTDIVLPSKLGNLLCTARPLVVAAAAGSELSRIIRQAECGLVVAQENAEEMAGALRKLHADAGLREALGRNGYAYMQNHLGHRVVLDAFVCNLKALDSVLGAAAQAELPPAA